MCDLASEAAEVIRRLPPTEQRKLLLLALIADEKHTEMYRQVRGALRARNYSEVDRLLDQLVTQGGDTHAQI
jgi:hypothetical protein